MAIGPTMLHVAMFHPASTMRNEGGKAASLVSGGRLFSLSPHRGLKGFIEPSRMTKSCMPLGKRMLLACVLELRRKGPRTSPWGEEAIVMEGLAKSCGLEGLAKSCGFSTLGVRQRCESRSPFI